MIYMMCDGLEIRCIDESVYKSRVEASFWFFFLRHSSIENKRKEKDIYTVGTENADPTHCVIEAIQAHGMIQVCVRFRGF